MKYEWRKIDKKVYIPKSKPEIIDLKSYTYIVLKGKGNPNSQCFSDDIGTLYALAYTIKMSLKKLEGCYDWTVFPLEGIWNLNNEGQELYLKGTPVIELKDYLVYELMIRQPEFVTEDLVSKYKAVASKKKKNPKILDIEFRKTKPKTVCQCLHNGSYDNEPATFDMMEEYTKKQGYTRKEKIHTEIYITDARKTEPDKLKTTLRFDVM